MMIYFDTNVLVYALIDQGQEKMRRAQTVIEEAVIQERFVISPLVIQELIFVLSKLKLDRNVIHAAIQEYLPFSIGVIDGAVMRQAAQHTHRHNCGRNINDVLHLLLAQNYADKIVTFDRDLAGLKQLVTIPVECLE